MVIFSAFMEFFLYLVELANLPTAQLHRIFNYVLWAGTFSALIVPSITYRWRFRYLYIATVLHLFMVVFFAALISIQVAPPPEVRNLVWSVTTTIIALAATHGWLNSDPL